MSKTKKEGIVPLKVDNEFFKNMKKQKRLLLVLNASKLIPQDQIEDLQGILSLFDHIQDVAVDKKRLRFDKNKVFDLGPDEDTQPEEFKKWQDKFNAEVKKLDNKIIENFKQKFY